MQISPKSESVLKVKTPLLAIPIEGLSWRHPVLAALDKAMSGKLKKFAKDEGFKGKPDEVLLVTASGRLAAERIMLLGIPTTDHGLVGGMRAVAAKAARWTRNKGLSGLALIIPESDALSPEERLQLLAEGVQLGSYRFDTLKTGSRKANKEPKRCWLVFASQSDSSNVKISHSVRQSVYTAQAHAGGIELARDLVNRPACSLTPQALVAEAVELANQTDMTCQIMGPKEIEQEGMELLAAVGRGSRFGPQFIHLGYRPTEGPVQGTLALVGKGITFDSGGLSLKPPASQPDMKSDMAGAATVLGTLQAAYVCQLPWAIHGIIPACENMPDGMAYRPGDVFGSLDGKSVEIRNTDAEGRLILADGLAFARTLQPDVIVDFATLTGACAVALGSYTAGVFANDESWAERFLMAAERAGEDVWRLPLTRRLRSELKSNVADLANIGSRYGGAITAALFLQEFVADVPWIHVDIAGPAFQEKVHGFHPRGATGFGVLTMLRLLEDDAA